MPWYLPEDLVHFKELTIAYPVIMGRSTWDSLDPRFRPLPGRRNIVITRNPDWVAEGAEPAHSVDEAIALVTTASTNPLSTNPASTTNLASVIGGAQVYAAFLPLADRLEVTEINADYDGDTFAPRVRSNWKATVVEPASGWLTSRHGLEYRFLRYERN